VTIRSLITNKSPDSTTMMMQGKMVEWRKN